MQKIVPFLWFENKAEEAAHFYVSIFKNSKIEDISRYGDAGPGPSGSVMVVEFQLDGQDFMAINGGESPALAGPAAIALFVNCETQPELDTLWEKLSEGGEILQCGWLRDKYGFSWNIVPVGLGDVLGGPDPVKSQRAMKAMLQMKKLDIDALKEAYAGG
ncbi:MAG TPA: VOC family protein [Candidatus Baltobacteraceae bacterium]|jgi:predicted 3-demethylubiquinone-9 3-methyltransferase (glyoxalase superfamily)